VSTLEERHRSVDSCSLHIQVELLVDGEDEFERAAFVFEFPEESRGDERYDLVKGRAS
jgi:hypothetical protein